MSILIKGMEMPKSCLECRLYNDPWCMAKKRNQWRTAYNRPQNGERQNDCPLIPVPPHGRLIDADALDINQREEQAFADYEKEPDDEFIEGIWNGLHQAAKCLSCAPTIIPAEEGE